ncbi:MULTISPECIES: hypothetical protein [unclassified Peribacillus]|uniref:hypothetical protein n=1 Tax=unclassified Peribacillus TaxID=2675266 RepID=UPI001E44AAA9|nr:hypothetical protein [Peribacillus sp. Bi96]
MVELIKKSPVGKEITTAQIVLAWVHAQKHCTNSRYAQEELRNLNDVLSKIKISGIAIRQVQISQKEQAND